MRPFLALLCAALCGCEAPPRRPENIAFISFANGTIGRSNDPLKFPKPGVAVVIPYEKLESGMFVNRLDVIGFGYRFVIHQLIRKEPDGTWVMQGYNRRTNPMPDIERLTPKTYWGVSYPSSDPIPTP